MLDLKSMFPDELKTEMKRLGHPAFRGDQLFNWASKGVDRFEEMANLPRGLREDLEKTFYLTVNEIASRQASSDGTVKYALRLHDGKIIESVFMRYRHGFSLCLSTQVGCRMNCSFCASTIGGLERQLSAGEMLGQILTVQKDQDVRIGNIVLMGSGEPFDNYDQVIRFLRLAHEEKGLNLGYRSMTLSTSGLVPGIRRLAEEGMPLTLAVSLHAPEDDLRTRLMPVNRKYPLAVLMEACRAYAEKTGRRITFEYALMKGVNDSEACFEKTARLLKGMLCHVNIIGYNPVTERNFTSADKAVQEHFRAYLEKAGIPATVRRTLGDDIDAACGQLRNRLKPNV